MTFRSITAAKKYYLPMQFKREQWDKMSPEEKGKYLAEETMKNIKF